MFIFRDFTQTHRNAQTADLSSISFVAFLHNSELSSVTVRLASDFCCHESISSECSEKTAAIRSNADASITARCAVADLARCSDSETNAHL